MKMAGPHSKGIKISNTQVERRLCLLTLLELKHCVLSVGYWIFSFSLFCASIADAQNTNTVVSPELIVAQALSHNRQIAIAGSEVTAANARKQQARAAALPSLKLDARAGHYDGLVESVLGPIVIPEIEDRYSFNAELNQTLFAGGRIVNSMKSAKFDEQAAEYSRRSVETDVHLLALIAYWNWSKAICALDALQAAVARIEAHTADIRNLREAGRATENDVLSTEVLLDQTKLKLQDSKRFVELAKARITHLTGAELPKDALPMRPGTVENSQPVHQEEAVSRAISDRPESAAAALAVKSAQVQTKVTRAGYVPQVSVAARYEEARPNAMFFPPEDKWENDTFVGAMVTWNLFDGGLARAKAAEADARTNQAKLRSEQVAENIKLEVKEAKIQVESVAARLNIARRAEESARQNLDVARNQWQSGMARHSDVLDAEAKYADAQYETAVSSADVALAKAAMDHAMGKLEK